MRTHSTSSAIASPRHRGLVAVGLAVGLLLAACGGGDATEPAPDATGGGDATATTDGSAVVGGGELEDTSISIGLGLDPGLAPQMVAIDKGFLEDRGFTDIKTSMYDAGALSGEALAAGEIDLWGPANFPPINMRHNGVPIVVTGTAAGGWSEKLVVRSDAGVTSAEDLKDIKITLLEGSASSAVVSKFADELGMSVSDLQLVNLPPAEELVALANDEVQGMLIWNPWTVRFEEEYPDVPITTLWEQNTSYFPESEGEELDASSSRMLFVMTENFITTTPNKAAAVMESMFEAQEWLRDPANREEAIDIFVKYTEYERSTAEAVWDDFTFEPALDQEYLDDMATYTDYLTDVGAIADPVSAQEYTYAGFVEAYDPAMVGGEGYWQP